MTPKRASTFILIATIALGTAALAAPPDIGSLDRAAMLAPAPQDAGADAASSPVVIGQDIPGAPTSGTALVNEALADLDRGDYRHLLALLLVVVAAFSKKLTSNLPGKVGAWFATDAGVLLTVLVTSEAGAFATVLLTPMKLSVHVVLNAVFVGFTGVGVHQAFTKVWAQYMGKLPANQPVIGSVIQGGKAS